MEIPQPCESPNSEKTKNTSRGRSLLYRYEYEGILVYDCYSRLSTSSSLIPEGLIEKKESEIEEKVSVKGAPEYDKSQFENMKKYSPTKVITPQYTLVVPQENTLKFESRFEGGNLHKAVKVNENEYNLLIDYDTETQGHTQWFYFSVVPYKPGHSVRFNLINYMKFESLFSVGMKPLVFSKRKFDKLRLGWHREGYNLGYYQNSYKRHYTLPGSSAKYHYYYTLTFTYTFEHPIDEVFFAYSYPYSYTQLKKFLDSLQEKNKKVLRINNFCSTLAGNQCFLLTITHNIDSYTTWEQENKKLKKTSAGRRYIKLKELKDETRIRYFNTSQSNIKGKK